MTPSALRAQVQWLTRHFDVVPLRQLLELTLAQEGPPNRPVAAVTFDDGYQEVMTHVLPTFEDLGIVATVFPVCGQQEQGRGPLWFDAYYQLLQAAIRGRDGVDPSIDGTRLSDWVTGTTKERLQRATSRERSAELARLAGRLGVKDSAADGSLSYLSLGDMRELVARGWSVGVHGSSHTRFTLMNAQQIEVEVQASIELATRLDPGPIVLAYPDGDVDPRVRSVIAGLGVRWALTVTPGSAGLGTDPLAVPRFRCRGDSHVPSPRVAELLCAGSL